MSETWPQLVLVAGKDPVHSAGGHETLVRATGRVARAIGLAPTVFCVGDRDEVAETPFGTLHRVRAPLAGLFGAGQARNLRSVHAPFCLPALRRAIVDHIARSQRAHIVYGFQVWSAAGIRGALAARGSKVPVAILYHAYTSFAHEWEGKRAGARLAGDVSSQLLAGWEHFWMARVWSRLERQPLRDCDLVAVNYESVRRLVLDLGAPPERIRKIASTADGIAEGSGTRVRAASPDAPRIVTVSRHDPRKGLDVLLRALARLKDQGIQFRARLVGPGALLEAHRALAKQLGLGSVVEVVGWVADVDAELAAADLFVLPSLEEGSGSLSLIEAARLGLALVASGIDGLLEDIEDGVTGVLVPPGEPAALATAIAGIISDPLRLARLQAAARALFEKRFSPARLEQDLSRVFGELATILRPQPSA